MKCLTFFICSSVLFISVVIFGSQPTYATSQSFDFTSNPGRNYVYWDSSNSSLSFTPTFYKVENLSIGTCSNTAFYGIVSVVYNNGNFSDSTSAWVNPDCSFLLIGSIMSNATQLKFSSYSFPTGFRLTLYDYDPSLGDPCPVCPEVPDDSQTLLDIKKAIYTIPAVLLVIYFFYIMFGWYLGGRS